jgi:haloacetate dehalogenase
MAADCLALMRELGHERFAVAGHDRGGYVTFRLAMDHPPAVSHLAVLAAIPIWRGSRPLQRGIRR